MKTLIVTITDVQGTVLDSADVPLMQSEIDSPAKLHRCMAAGLEDINWNRISNLLGSEE